MNAAKGAVTTNPSGLRSQILRGGAVIGGVSVLLRASSIIAQLILGRLLLGEEFGLFAIAWSFGAFGDSLRSILKPVLIEAVVKNPDDAVSIYSRALYGLIGLCAVGIALSPSIGAALDVEALPLLLAFVLLTTPLRIVPVLGFAQLNADLDFGTFGRIISIAGVIRHVSSVIFALSGFGAYSFAVATVVASIVEIVAVRKVTGPFPSIGRPSIRPTVRRSATTAESPDAGRRWIFFSALALTLAVSGDYLGASVWISPATLGLYFFAYQLTGALFGPMNLAATTVLVPAFVKIEGEQSRRDSYLTTLRSLSVVGTLFFIATAVVIAPLANWLWAGAWNGAIAVMIIFSAYAPIRLIHPATQSIARGCGFWSLFASDMALIGVVTISAAFVGAWVGGLIALALFVNAGHLAVTMSTSFRVGSRLKVPLHQIAKASLLPWLVGLGCLGITHLLTAGIDSTEFAGLPIRIALLGTLLSVGLLVPNRQMLLGLFGSLRARSAA